METVIDALAAITHIACGSTTMVLNSEYPILALPAVRIFSLLAHRYTRRVDSKESLHRGVTMLSLTFLFDWLILVVMYEHIVVLVWTLTDICYIAMVIQLRVDEHFLESNRVQEIDPSTVTRESV